MSFEEVEAISLNYFILCAVVQYQCQDNQTYCPSGLGLERIWQDVIFPLRSDIAWKSEYKSGRFKKEIMTNHLSKKMPNQLESTKPTSENPVYAQISSDVRNYLLNPEKILTPEFWGGWAYPRLAVGADAFTHGQLNDYDSFVFDDWTRGNNKSGYPEAMQANLTFKKEILGCLKKHAFVNYFTSDPSNKKWQTVADEFIHDRHPNFETMLSTIKNNEHYLIEFDIARYCFLGGVAGAVFMNAHHRSHASKKTKTYFKDVIDHMSTTTKGIDNLSLLLKSPYIANSNTQEIVRQLEGQKNSLILQQTLLEEMLENSKTHTKSLIILQTCHSLRNLKDPTGVILKEVISMIFRAIGQKVADETIKAWIENYYAIQKSRNEITSQIEPF